MKTTSKIKLLELKFKKNLGANLFGVYKSAFLGSGLEFAEIRQYDYADSIKNIDWKTTAKKQELHTKKFEEERNLNIIFALDISNSMQFKSKHISKKDLQEEIFFSIGLSSIENNDNIGAFIYDEEIKYFIPPKKGFINLYNILEKLNTTSSKQKNTSQIFAEIIKRKIKNTLIFILTDDMNIENEKVLNIASKQNQIIYINIFDYFENNLEQFNSNISLNFENNFTNINLQNKDKINKYKSLRLNKLDSFRHKLQKNNIGYLYIDTSLNLYNELIKYFYKIK